MITLTCVIFIIIGILLIIGVALDDTELSFGSFCRTCGGVSASIILIAVGIGMLISKDDKPKAIDVYRNKTELQIEQKVVNNQVVSSDSIVIWKRNN